MSDIKFFLSWAHADHALKEDLVSRLTPRLKNVKNPVHRSQHRITIQQLEVAAQLLDAVDAAHALDLHGPGAALS